MSSIPGVDKIDGVLKATARNIEPPPAWTNDLEILGGESFWMPGGEMYDIVGSRGIDPMTIRPLYATEPGTGAYTVLFEADDPARFFLFDRQVGWLRMIIKMDRLEEIVGFLNEEDNQLDSIPTVDM